MNENEMKSFDVPNNYAGCLTLLQAMGLLALLGLAIVWVVHYFSL